MSNLSSNNFFSRIETLKKWQEEQQDRLRKQQSNHKTFLLQAKNRLHTALDLKYESLNNHGDGPMQGIALLDISDDESRSCVEKNSPLLDDKPIMSPQKSFDEILNEKLKHDSEREPRSFSPKPKRAFLKKGTGLIRFRMSNENLRNKQTKNFNKPKYEPAKRTDKQVNNKEFKLNKPILKKPMNTSWASVLQKPKAEKSNLDVEYHALLSEISVLRNNQLEDSPGQKAFEKALEQEIQSKKDMAELKVFEFLEQKATNSSFCSTSSLATKLIEATKPSPLRVPPNNMHWEELLKPQKKNHVHFTNEDDSDSSVNSDDVLDSNISLKCIRNFQDDSAWSDDSCKVTENETTLDEDDNILKRKITTNNIGTNTEQTWNPEHTKLMQMRLDQLENEIKMFRSLTEKVQKSKDDLDAEHKELEKQKIKMKHKLDEELTETRLELEEEHKKLQKDRMIYEKYIKGSKLKPSRKDREEMSLLQTQLINAREEIKLKDSRHGAAQAKYRTQIKHLEKEIASLKNENESLRKQNGKLEATQKLSMSRKPSETKILHEINKNISKLTQESQLLKKSKRSPDSSNKLDKCLNKSANKKNSSHIDVCISELNSSNDSKSNDEIMTEEREHAYFNNCDKTKKPPDKENNYNLSNIESVKLDRSFEAIEQDYERMFGKLKFADLTQANVSNINDSYKKDREEKILVDGTKEITYTNGNIKTISPDGYLIKMKYYNGDVKETSLETGTIKYFYAQTETWHTTYADGNEVLEFPNGQIEKRSKDGHMEVNYPNGSQRCISPCGTEEVKFPDGTIVITNSEGEKILSLPNGQKEIHTHDHKRREYPDGTIKVLYMDGVQETRYANGRIRLKDKDGNLIMDSGRL